MSIYPYIYKNYWKFICWKNHNKIPYYLQQLEKSQYWSRQEIEKLQIKKLKNLILHSYKTVPYYKKILKENKIHPTDITDFKDFRKIPILSKIQIRQNLNNLIAENVKKENLKKDYTGGSTGEPLEFYKDKNYSEIGVADRFRSYGFSGYKLGDKKATLWGAYRDDPTENFRNQLNQKLSRSLFINTSKLNENDMIENTRKLQKFKPHYIIGYSASLYFFANFFKKNNVHDINPKSIISAAEMLYDYQRKLINDAFSTNVFNHYGCREIGAIASECNQHNGLHILAENQYIEIIDKNGESCESGETGRILVTNLNNYSFPFIRYEIGDMAKKSVMDKCNCNRGLPLLEEICGRIVQNFILPGGNIIHPSFFLMPIIDIKGIENFQVIQEKINMIKLNIVKTDELNENEFNQKINTLKKDLGEDVTIEVNFIKEIEVPVSGKHQYTISKIIEDYYRT